MPKNKKNYKSSYNTIVDFLKDAQNIPEDEFEKIYIDTLNKDRSDSYNIVPTPREIIDFSIDVFSIISDKKSFDSLIDPYMGTGGFLAKADKKLNIKKIYGFEKKQSLKKINDIYFNKIGFTKTNNLKYQEFDNKGQYDLIFTNPDTDIINKYSLKKIIENNLKENGYLLIFLQDEKLKDIKKDEFEEIDPKIVINLPPQSFPKAPGIKMNIVIIQKKEYSGKTLFVNLRNENKNFFNNKQKINNILNLIQKAYKNTDKEIKNENIKILDWTKQGGELNGLYYHFTKKIHSNLSFEYEIIEKSFFKGLGQLKTLGKLLKENDIFSLSLPNLSFPDIEIKEIIKDIQTKQKIETIKLYEILIALTIKRFLIFSGPPGVGKTSLSKKISEVLGGDFIKIPVKSNFTDETGLLGYWNPLLGKYEGTQIIEFLFESMKNQDIPYFLLLYEMNLSKIENYFSDFLAGIDEENGQSITLFDTVIDNEYKFKNIKYFAEKYELSSEEVILKDIKTKKEISISEILNSDFKNSFSITVNIKLGKNLYVIGTINEDETTNSLSNKVLDRAFYINLGIENLFTDKKDNENNDEDKNLDFIDENVIYKDIFEENIFKLIDFQQNENIFPTKDKDFLNEINKLIGQIDKNDVIAYRTIEDMGNFIHRFKKGIDREKFEESIENKEKLNLEKKALDISLCQKVCPKIKNYTIILNKDNIFNKIKNKIKEHLGEESQSFKILDNMTIE